MDWYYADTGRQIGPLNDAAFGQLVGQGAIRPDTLVWHAGMPNWLPYRSLQPAQAPVNASPYQPQPQPQPQPMQAPAPVFGAEMRYCAECGRQFPATEMAAFGAALVCANCKPIYAQKLREGVLSQRRYQYGGFWIRFAAVVVDGIILWVVNLIPNLLVLGAIGFNRRNPRDFMGILAAQGVLMLIYLAVSFVYETGFIGRFGATPGKMVCQLQVINADGSKVSYQKAAARYGAKLINSFTLLIGYIMAAFDDEKRALHDRICDTRVIRKSAV